MGCGSSSDSVVTVDSYPYDGGNEENSTNKIQVEPDVSKIVIDEDCLQQYMDIEKEIHKIEKTKCLQRLHVAVDNLDSLSHELMTLQVQQDAAEKQIIEKRSKVKGDNDQQRIMDLAKSGNDIDPKASKADRAYFDALKNKANIDKAMEDKKKECESHEADISRLNVQTAELLDCYLKQDELVGNMFGTEGELGEMDCELQHKLSDLEERKRRIEVARRKWKEAHLLLEFACRQLALAVQKWQDLPKVPSINVEVRYSLAEEARSGLVDANRTIQEASECFPDIDFPYGSPSHIDELNDAADQLCKSDPSANNCPAAIENYSKSHRRALSLLTVFNNILNTTIHRDMVEVSEEVRKTSKKIRKSRIKLIQMKIKEKNGNVGIDSGNESDGCECEESLKKMLSGCKGDNKCPVDRSRLAGLPNLDIGKSVRVDDLDRPSTEQLDDQLRSLKSEFQRETQQFKADLSVKKARSQRQLGSKLSDLKEKRAKGGNSPNPDNQNENE